MIPVPALAGGSYIFLGFVVVALFAVVFGYFTYGGSGIGAHPSESADDAPGSGEPSSSSGKGRESSDPRVEGGAFDSHGTR